MQVLKDEVRERILISAENLFYQYGYAGTTARKIAEQSGTSVSNLYKYFKNKEEIFQETLSEYSKTVWKEFESILNHDHSGNPNSIEPESIVKKIVSGIVRDKKRFVILIEGSKGTVFENYHKKLINNLALHIQAFPAISSNSFFAFLIAENLILSLVRLVKKRSGNEELLNDVWLLMKYHFFGMDFFK